MPLPGALIRSTARLIASMCGATSVKKLLPASLSWMPLCARSSSVRPTNCSSAWIRRVSAGDDSASASAAALSDPSRATDTNAWIDPTGGSLRMSALSLRLWCSATGNIYGPEIVPPERE